MSEPIETWGIGEPLTPEELKERVQYLASNPQRAATVPTPGDDTKPPNYILAEKLFEQIKGWLAANIRFHPTDLYQIIDRASVPREEYERVKREMDEANSKLSKIGRLIDFAEKDNDEKSEQEVACSASFQEAMAYEALAQAEAERDALRAELAAVKLELADTKFSLTGTTTANRSNCETIKRLLSTRDRLAQELAELKARIADLATPTTNEVVEKLTI